MVTVDEADSSPLATTTTRVCPVSALEGTSNVVETFTAT
jgi:hypothetical protein